MQASRVGDVSPLSAREVAARDAAFEHWYEPFGLTPSKRAGYKATWDAAWAARGATLEAATSAARREGIAWIVQELRTNGNIAHDSWRCSYYLRCHCGLDDLLAPFGIVIEREVQGGELAKAVRAAQSEPPRRAGEGE